MDSAGGTAGIQVHPHVCGELIEGKQRRYSNYGSSPRVWGTVIFIGLLQYK